MEMPDWLKTVPTDKSQVMSKNKTSPLAAIHLSPRKSSERFLDKTLHHIISFIGDSLFNEDISRGNGLLQKIEPRLKIITIVALLVVLNIQRSVEGIAIFLFAGFLMASLSKVPPYFFLKRLLPAVILTALIAIPATLNPVVDGEPLFIIYRFGREINIGQAGLSEIAITRQGLASAITLFLRVVASVSFVFLMTMTTQPNTYIRSVSSFIPGSMGAIVSIGYRYIFFLIRKIERFIMGFKSRNIAATKTRHGRRWVASRMGLLFSISMKLSEELGMAMESRGCRGEKFKVQSSKLKISDMSKIDIVWSVLTMIFAGVMLWKSLA